MGGMVLPANTNVKLVSGAVEVLNLSRPGRFRFDLI